MRFDTVILPFDKHYLADKFSLNQSYVKQENFELMGGIHYQLTFDSLEHAQAFYEIIKRTGCHPQLWSHNNSIEIRCDQGEKILHAAGTDNDEIAPFSVDFLSCYFDLDRKQVIKTITSSFFYEIYFDNWEHARDFCKHFTKLGFCSKWDSKTKSVSINNIQIMMLLETAAKLPQRKSSPGSSKPGLNAPISLLPGSLLTPCSPLSDVKTDTASSRFFSTQATNLPSVDQGNLNPFTPEWLSQHFSLNVTDLLSTELNSTYGYEIRFKNLSTAEQFYQTMTLAQCFPQLWKFNNSVELNVFNKDKIIQAAKVQHKSDAKLPVKSLVSSSISPGNSFFTQHDQYIEDYLFTNVRVIAKHITLARDATNDQDFIKHWVHAFRLTSPSAISLYKSNEESSRYGASLIGIESDHRADREMTQFFICQLHKVSNLNRLDDLFLHIADWDTFYASIAGIKQSDVLKFICFVRRVKIAADEFGDVFRLAEANLYHKTNPYLMIAASPAKADFNIGVNTL